MSDEKPVLFSPAPGKGGMTELHFAAYCGNRDELVRCLKAGLDPNKKDEYREYTPLLWLADMAAVDGPRLEMLNILVAHGADIHERSRDGLSAVALARESGSDAGDELAEALLRLGASE
jgi:ankyrin repeat protein